MKKSKKGDKKLNDVISRLSKQTESSGRKNRNPSNDISAKPYSTYTSISYNPYGSAKKSNRKK